MRQRKSIRLPDYDYSWEGDYFVTICVKDRLCALGNISGEEMILNDSGRIVEKWWRSLPDRFEGVNVDEFVVMPNHIHGIISIIETDCQTQEWLLAKESGLAETTRELLLARRQMTLTKIIGFFKMNSAKEINNLLKTSGKAFWQRNYYEHVIRNSFSYMNIRKYIASNPQNWINDSDNPENWQEKTAT